VREERSIDLVRRVHAFVAKGGGRVLNEADMVAKLHAKATGGFDVGVRYEADEDDFLDAPLFELGVEIGIGEATLCPVLMHDHVVIVGAEFGIELSAPVPAAKPWAWFTRAWDGFTCFQPL
jgi:hypothetical protein